MILSFVIGHLSFVNGRLGGITWPFSFPNQEGGLTTETQRWRDHTEKNSVLPPCLRVSVVFPSLVYQELNSPDAPAAGILKAGPRRLRVRPRSATKPVTLVARAAVTS